MLSNFLTLAKKALYRVKCGRLLDVCMARKVYVGACLCVCVYVKKKSYGAHP